jgi:prephenate dehydratase
MSHTQPVTRIALSGIAGSFSEEATRKFLSDAKIEAELVYAVSARAVFESVTGGHTQYGLVPLENSNGGIVLETVHAASDFTYHIEKIFEIDVQQNILVLPGTGREDITKIVSHQQAIAQCKFYLRRHWPGEEFVEYADTALAAKDLAAGKFDAHTATISSRAAAELYHLEILEPSVQDLKFNYTSFMVITRHP